MFFDILFAIALFASLIIAVCAIVRSTRNIKRSNARTWDNKGRQAGYLITSFLHLIAGISISLCFLGAVLFMLLPSLKGG